MELKSTLTPKSTMEQQSTEEVVQSMYPPRTLRPLTGEFVILRLDPRDPVPSWALTGRTEFTSITRTSDELSIICPVEMNPDPATGEPGWHCLRLEGPFGLDEPGILASVVAPLAEARLSVFAVASHDTDHLLVRDRAAAHERLVAAGHTVLPALAAPAGPDEPAIGS
jgi:hypothetical protein